MCHAFSTHISLGVYFYLFFSQTITYLNNILINEIKCSTTNKVTLLYFTIFKSKHFISSLLLKYFIQGIYNTALGNGKISTISLIHTKIRWDIHLKIQNHSIKLHYHIYDYKNYMPPTGINTKSYPTNWSFRWNRKHSRGAYSST